MFSVPGIRPVGEAIAGSDTTSLEITDLNGDAHVRYLIELDLRITLSAGTVFFRPNDADNRTERLFNGAAQGPLTTGAIYVSGAAQTRNLVYGFGSFYAARVTGIYRMYQIEMSLSYVTSGTDRARVGSAIGVIEDDTNNVTSLTVSHSVTDGILEGSAVRLWRLL